MRPKTVALKRASDDAIERYAERRYKDGMRAGLEVAERIVGWLTRQPDTRRQRETREMAETAIEKARRGL